MFILEFIANHFVMVAELGILLILLGVSVHVPRRMVRLTRAATIMILCSSIIYSIEAYFGNIEDPDVIPRILVWRYILTYSNYTILSIILVVIMQISAPMKRRKLILFLIPDFINAVLCF